MATLCTIFDPPFAAVRAQGGFVSHLAGDAFCAVFPGPRDEAASKAEAAARTMMEADPRRSTRFGEFSFPLRVGLSWGDIAWGIVGAGGYGVYFLRGPAISAASRASRSATQEPTWGGADAPLEPVASRPLSPVQWESLADFPSFGEFRDVTSVFVGLPEASATPDAIGRLAERIRHDGGFLSRFDFADKGPHAAVFFGAPTASPRAHPSSLRFALDVIRVAPEARVGMARGILYAGFNGGSDLREFTCLGDATNLAARLMTLGPTRTDPRRSEPGPTPGGGLSVRLADSRPVASWDPGAGRRANATPTPNPAAWPRGAATPDREPHPRPPTLGLGRSPSPGGRARHGEDPTDRGGRPRDGRTMAPGPRRSDVDRSVPRLARRAPAGAVPPNSIRRRSPMG